ncbi:BPI fold-containing family B member 2 [Sceloporus undulatus]|uniref:BPI fold-containing family B member 2 n=1 Tax=Sceloporus undulatus TaxID=8520 RepID=UPI001C4A960D|nr:BPI fold-containing family B member 2 [Sceloporus undulatus]
MEVNAGRIPLRLRKVSIPIPRMFKLFTLSILLCLLVPSRGTTPGTVVRINQEALEYVCQQGKPSLLRGLEVIKIPGFSRGQIFGSLLNIVGLIAPLELKLGSSINLDVRVLRSSGGFPILSITACKSLLGDVQIILGGNNLLGILKPIQDHIRAVLVDKAEAQVARVLEGSGLSQETQLVLLMQMCLSVSNVVLGLNAKLGTLVGVNRINPMSQLQFSMLDSPEITSDYIDLDLNAAFALMGKPLDVSSGHLPPFSLPPPRMNSRDSMVNLGISEHLLTNLFGILKQSGALNYNIQDPLNAKGYRLTTSMLESAIPSIRQRYPQELAIGLNVVLSKFPIISFHEGAALLRLRLSVQVIVDTAGPSSLSQNLCALGVDLSFGLKLDVTVTSLKVSAALRGEVGLEVESSSMKIEQISHLRKVIVPVLEKAFQLHLNAALSVGISLPKLSNVQYVDPQIEIHEGYAQVNCDLDYVP